MAVSKRRLFGGLLTGAGEGQLQRARALRAEALLRLREEETGKRHSASLEAADRRSQAAITAAEKRAETAATERRGLLSTVVPNAEGQLIGITQGGEKRDLGIQSGNKKDYPDSGMSVEDKRELDAAIDRHTSGKGSLEGEKTDWDGVATRLDKLGRQDLADRVRSMETPGSGKVDVGSAEYREAKRQAEEWASGKAGLLRSDKTDFSDYGGNRAEAINAKTLELYRELTGAGGTKGSDGVPGTQAQGTYKTAEEVGEAYRAGKLSQAEAKKILREQFGYE